MESDTRSADEKRIDDRLTAIRQRMDELTDLWNYACDTDAQYRMVEAEQKALIEERRTLCEIKGDL